MNFPTFARLLNLYYLHFLYWSSCSFSLLLWWFLRLQALLFVIPCFSVLLVCLLSACLLARLLACSEVVDNPGNVSIGEAIDDDVFNND